MQDYIGHQFGSHDQMSVVFDQPHFSEFVHEVRDARPRRAYHFGQGFVTKHGDAGIPRHRVPLTARASEEHEPAVSHCG